MKRQRLQEVHKRYSPSRVVLTTFSPPETHTNPNNDFDNILEKEYGLEDVQPVNVRQRKLIREISSGSLSPERMKSNQKLPASIVLKNKVKEDIRNNKNRLQHDLQQAKAKQLRMRNYGRVVKELI